MMDQHDLKSSGIASSLRRFHSPEEPDLLGKEKSSSDSHEVVSDGGSGLDKQKHGFISDHEVNCCESAHSAAMEVKCLNHDQVSSLYCSKENADESIFLSSVISPSRSLELVKEDFSKVTCRVISSTGNLQDSGLSASSTKGGDSTTNIFMKSDVSLEGRQTLGKERDELAGRRMNECWLNIDEDGFKSVMATCHSMQIETESASSNSTRAILPASSNNSCQETSVNAKSCEHSKHSGIDTGTSTNYKCNPGESPVKSSVLSIDAQTDSKDELHLIGFSLEKEGHMNNSLNTVDIVGTKCEKHVGTIADSNLVIAEKIKLQKSNPPEKEDADFLDVKPCSELNNVLEEVQRVARDVASEDGTHRETSGSCFSVQGRSGETVHMNSVNSAVSDKGCCIETGRKIHFGSEQDRSGIFCLNKDEFDPEMSTGSLDVKETLKYSDHMKKHKDNDGQHGQGSSPLSTKSEYITAINKPNYISGFDLNENVLVDEVDYPNLSIKGKTYFLTENISKPMPVVAKSGIFIGLPKSHMQLDEAGGWRGSAATSAFRRTFPQCAWRTKASSAMNGNNGSERSQVNGIDLNIAAEGGDCDMELIPEKCSRAVSSFPSERPSIEISSSRAQKFNIDLNCVTEDDDNGPQLCLPASSFRSSVKDFDLNYNLISADECSDSRLSAQGTSVQRDRVFGDSMATLLGNGKQSESNNVGTLYHAHLSPMQSFSHGQSKPFLTTASAIHPSSEQMPNVVSLQPRQIYASYPPPTSLPPHTLLCNNAFFVDPNNRLSSSVYPPGVISYNITNPQLTSFFPQMLGSSASSAFRGTPYITHGPGGHSFSDIAIIRPSFEPNGGLTLSENGSWGGNDRQPSIPVNNTTDDRMRSFQQLALSATPMKRREPDGGWESHQLGFRQMTN